MEEQTDDPSPQFYEYLRLAGAQFCSLLPFRSVLFLSGQANSCLHDDRKTTVFVHYEYVCVRRTVSGTTSLSQVVRQECTGTVFSETPLLIMLKYLVRYSTHVSS
jgi:hypothetical protein